MKLYTKNQLRTYVLLVSSISVLAIVIAAWALGFGKVPDSKSVEPASYRSVPETQVAGEAVQYKSSASLSEDATNLGDELQNTVIYQRLNQGVVNITSVVIAHNWFLQPAPQEGSGSGSIIDQQGRLLTNYHVVKGAQELTVTLADGSDYQAKVIGADPENDLAVIQFDPQGKQLVTVPFGTSSDLMVGQKVLAIGNPFGLERTLTTGIVSGLGRPVQNSDGLIIQEMIQTDASINPGNSGGPLLNSRGEMIGINTMIYSTSGGSVGIGFAVPVDTAIRVVPELIENGEVNRGWIDITPVQLFPQLVQYVNLPVKQGILVSAVIAGSLAEKAGLKGGSSSKAVKIGRTTVYLGGDIITEIDGIPIASIGDLYRSLEDNKPGETVDVKVIRGRSERILHITLSERS